jgi:serine protease AprX
VKHSSHSKARTWVIGLALGVAAVTTAAPAAADAPTTPSLFRLTKAIGAQDYWAAGYTGKGVDIAIIDTGTAPVDGLDAPGKLIHGADVSFDSQIDELRYLDAYGHGTHMAGIAAGRDTDEPLAPAAYVNRPDLFLGVAPDARVLSVKAGDAHGAVDVTQVIAAIDWVVAHRHDDGLNVRVINLSYGTDSVQPNEVSPLAHAVEAAWNAGIVVVVAAGNDGATYGRKDSPGLTAPARDPYVIAVGAADTKGTEPYADDAVAAFSNDGDAVSKTKRNPDVVAPGVSVASLRVPGSTIDEMYGAIAGEGERLIRGSGTSQAAAAVSGAVALLLQQRPSATPDQIKTLLRGYTVRLAGELPVEQGTGELNLRGALKAGMPTAPNNTAKPAASTGTGLIEADRGTPHLVDEGIELRGEVDIFGQPLSAAELASSRTAGTVWQGGTWFGRELLGADWTTIAGPEWSARGWSGRNWSARGWSGRNWSARGWSGRNWSARGWSARGWSAGTWGDSALLPSWTSALWSSASWK